MALSEPIVVVREAPSGLVRERWVFTLVGTTLILDRYHHERRYSKVDDFKTTKFYDQDHDGEDYGDWTWLGIDDVPWDDVETLAMTELMARFKVTKEK
jgi:hypothetical protein